MTTIEFYLYAIGSILVSLSYFSERRSKLLNKIVSKYLNGVSERINDDFKKSGEKIYSVIIPLIIFIIMILAPFLFLTILKYIPDTTTYFLITKTILVIMFFSIFAFGVFGALNIIFDPEIIVNVVIGGIFISIIRLLNKSSSIVGVIGILLLLLSGYMQIK